MSKIWVAASTAVATAIICAACAYFFYPKEKNGPAASVAKEASCELEGHKYLILKYNCPNQIVPHTQLIHNPDCSCFKAAKAKEQGSAGAVGSTK